MDCPAPALEPQANERFTIELLPDLSRDRYTRLVKWYGVGHGRAYACDTHGWLADTEAFPVAQIEVAA